MDLGEEGEEEGGFAGAEEAGDDGYGYGRHFEGMMGGLEWWERDEVVLREVEIFEAYRGSSLIRLSGPAPILVCYFRFSVNFHYHYCGLCGMWGMIIFIRSTKCFYCI